MERRRHSVDGRGQGPEGSAQRQRVLLRQPVQVDTRHRPHVERAVGALAVAQRSSDLRGAPAAQTRLRIGSEVGRDEDALRVAFYAHAASEVGAVAVDEAVAADLGVAQPAHLEVNEVRPTSPRIRVGARPPDAAARFPRRHPGDRLDVADQIPALRL